MKSPENFNLNIEAPEGGSSEISKLKAEMMSYKPLIEDAVKRQNLKEAEELFEEAKRLKEKLNELREKLKIKENKLNGIYPIKINGEKLELGPELGMMAWDEIPAKLEEINKTLKPEEKPWRVTTEEELKEIGKPIIKIWDRQELAPWQKEKKAREKVESLGFFWHGSYWTNNETSHHSDTAWFWYSSNGSMGNGPKSCCGRVRLIR